VTPKSYESMKKNIMFGGWGAFIMKIVIKKFFIFLEIISKNGTKYCNQPSKAL